MVQQAWKPHEIDYIITNHSEMTYKEIAKVLGRSSNSIYGQCYKMGLKCPRSQGRDLNRYRLYLEGEHIFTGTTVEIAEKYGYDRKHLYVAAHRGNMYDLGIDRLHKVMLIFREHDQNKGELS
jgi:hypothetical protein